MSRIYEPTNQCIYDELVKIRQLLEKMFVGPGPEQACKCGRIDQHKLGPECTGIKIVERANSLPSEADKP